MMLNRVSLNTIGLNRIGLNRIGKPSRGSSDRPYIDPEVLASLKAVCICYGKSNDDPDRAIVKNLVDPDNPFVISNAAFKLNSGFGKYEVDFTVYNNQNVLVSPNKIVSIAGREFISLLPYTELSKTISSYKIKVTGLIGELSYWYRNQDGSESRIIITKDGIYQLSTCYNVENGQGSGVGFHGSSESSCTIEQIPSFEGALVTDGIDDLITSTKTVQEMLGGSNEITVVSMIHQIDGNVNYTNGYTNYIRHGGGFIRNSVSGINGKGFNKTGIYGYTSTQLNSSNMGLGNVINNILGDKEDYSFERSSTYTLDDAKYSVQNFINANNQPSNEGSSVAWYWTIIANKVLTTDQINQVIAYFNLDRTLKPDILCDVKKQGITNENHAEFGDKLIDFSGNGRDIQLNNIAWKGDSGIGKYEVDFLDSSIWNSSNSTITSSKIDCKNAISHIMLLYYSVGSKEYPDIPSFKVIKTGADIDYSYINETGAPKSVKIVDGVNILPASHNTLYSGSGRFCGFGNPGMGNSVTITQIPSHAGALCLDGVNDFGKVTGMPIYKDYTFIIDYERISYTSSEVWTASVVSKAHTVGQGAFILMAANREVELSRQSNSFGSTTTFNRDDFTRTLLYQSKYKCGDVNLTVGEGVDGDTLWLGTLRDNDSRFFNGAIYSLMSFPYSMSEFLIERQLKKHKLGTLYPDMIELRPIIKGGSIFKYLRVSDNKTLYPGDYINVGDTIRFYVSDISGTPNEVSKFTVNGIEGTPKGDHGDLFDVVVTKSPQKINITIDEYIRYEDIVQPYPVLLRFNDENGNEVSWGGKFRVGSTITSIGSIADPESNLLNGLYSVSGLSLNGKAVTSSTSIVEKQMVFRTTATWLLDDNEPKCILSPRLLRIPNSSYKILGYIPDISGHGNHGVIHNSAYAEGSGVNEDGSYQFDGVDDFVTIPTVTGGGKQVLMKVNNNTINSILYDQRSSGASPNSLNNDFAIYSTNTADNNLIAYQARLVGKTYIDGILNTNITCEDLLNVLHNITITCDIVAPNNGVVPYIGVGGVLKDLYSKVALYDFMLFDDISTDDKIKQVNNYIGIEAKVELPPYYWDAYGKTNLDEDKATIQQRGVAVGDYDLTNYNHAYDKMSSYGGYEFAKFDNTLDWYNTEGNDSVEVVSRNGHSITLKRLTGPNFWYFQNSTFRGLISNVIPFKVNSNKNISVIWDVHGLSISEGKDKSVRVQELVLNPNEDNYTNLKTLNEEELAQIDISTNSLYYLLWFDLSTLAVDEEVTIEMLPLYPNGLVYDGVTDYSENVNIPALTDYTYILKREFLNKTAGSASIYKGEFLANGGRAFIADYAIPNGSLYGFSYGGQAKVNSLNTDKIIYGTRTSVNGTPITLGSNIDTAGFTIGKFDSYRNMVFYKLILYPKTIPLLQINFLKNLMERDEIIDLNNKIFIQE